MKLEVETHLNPDYISVHCDTRFSTEYIGQYAMGIKEECPLRDELKKVHGVTNATINNYTVGIEKGKVFTVEEIVERCKPIIEKHAALMEAKKEGL